MICWIDLKFDPENNEFLQGKIEMAKKVVERMDGKAMVITGGAGPMTALQLQSGGCFQFSERFQKRSGKCRSVIRFLC